VAGQPAQQVQRQRQHFERHEHGQQVVGGREHQHPADRQHGQREHLGLTGPGPLRLMLGRTVRHRRCLRRKGFQSGGDVGGSGGGARTGCRIVALVPLGEKDHGEHGDQQDGTLQQQRRTVDSQRMQDRIAARGVELPGDDDVGDGRGDQTPDRKHDLDAIACSPGQERLDEHAGHRNTEDDEYR
jgi:hypothetical protein